MLGKNNRIKLILIALFVLICLMSSMVNATEKVFKIGMSPCVLSGNIFQIDMANAAKDEAEKLGNVKFELYAPSDWNAFEEQIAIVEDLITKKVDLIILDPLNVATIIPAIEMAAEAGIPIINVDNKIESDKILTYIGTRNEEGGYLGAKWFAEALGGKGDIAIIQGNPATPNGMLRRTGARRAFAEYPNINIVAALGKDWTEGTGTRLAEDILSSHPDINGIFCVGDANAIGASTVIQKADHKIWLAGFDGTPQAIELIKKGEMDVTVGQRPAVIGRLAVRMAVAYLDYLSGYKGYAIFNKDIDSGTDVITKDNADEFLTGWGAD